MNCTPKRYLAVALFVSYAGSLQAQEWTRFRGPNGSGLSSATNIPTAWTTKDLRWKTKLAGVGHSSPVLWGQKIFLTTGDPAAGKRVVQCIAAAKGVELWSRSFACEKHRQHEHNSWASATPAVDERHVYVLLASPKDYLVVALTHDGQEKWRVDLGSFKSGHGFGVSPIVFEDLLIVPNEQESNSSVVALDRDTGKTRWQTPRKSRTTYSTPCVFAPTGRTAQLVLANYEHGVTSLDPRTGKVNWEVDVFDKRHMETSIASPIVAGDLVLGASGWLGVRKEVITLRPGKDGAAPQQVYNITKGSPLVPTPLAKDDLLFLWGDEGVVTCAELATGKELWRERVPGNYYSSPIAVGVHVYNVSREGEVIVLKASRTFDHVATNPLGEGSHSTPAVAGGTLYVRTFTHLVAIGGSAVEFMDVDGRVQKLSAPDRKATVLFFLLPDCPVSNSYAPEIKRFVADYAAKNVAAFIVHADPDVTKERAKQHAKEYDLSCPILLDPTHVLVKKTGATMAPEVAVLGPDQKVLYRGRIDDWYASIGKRRAAPTQRDLRNALDTVLRGQAVKTPTTPVIGCYLPEAK